MNGDAKADLFFGGHEWENSSATIVLVNPGNGNFLGVMPTVIPAVANEGVVLDVTATGSGNSCAPRAATAPSTSAAPCNVSAGPAWPAASPTPTAAPPGTTWLIPATVAGVPSLVSDDLQDGVVIAVTSQ